MDTRCSTPLFSTLFCAWYEYGSNAPNKENEKVVENLPEPCFMAIQSILHTHLEIDNGYPEKPTLLLLSGYGFKTWIAHAIEAKVSINYQVGVYRNHTLFTTPASSCMKTIQKLQNDKRGRLQSTEPSTNSFTSKSINWCRKVFWWKLIGTQLSILSSYAVCPCQAFFEENTTWSFGLFTYQLDLKLLYVHSASTGQIVSIMDHAEVLLIIYLVFLLF